MRCRSSVHDKRVDRNARDSALYENASILWTDLQNDPAGNLALSQAVQRLVCL
jgi:hypothetical protein